MKSSWLWVVLLVVLPLMKSDMVFSDFKPLGPPKASFKITPVSLNGGSRLMVVSPNEWYPLAQKLSKYLQDTHDQYAKLFGTIPAFQTTLRVIDAETFYKETGAPTWTNAMYFRGEITIPLQIDEPIELEDLQRSVKHEYMHSVINALSAGRCPGWLDEGLAQWIEGTVNPALEPSLKKWMFFNEPIPLERLQGGFTKLETDMVAPAYGQSLFAAKTVIHSFGFEEISKYLEALRNGKTKESAFTASFEVSENGFEKALSKSLKRWAYGNQSLKIASNIKLDSHNHNDERGQFSK
ncbi:MAG: peptidase MA family metallohydrolase [bacterium]|nr:peptidase MA family metallohydrolase [bacterium]